MGPPKDMLRLIKGMVPPKEIARANNKHGPHIAMLRVNKHTQVW